MKNAKTLAAGFLLIALVLPACDRVKPNAAWGPEADDVTFAAMVRSGFRDAGLVKVDRLRQDETQAFCSNPFSVDTPEGSKKSDAIMAANRATVKFPADGKWLGDWNAGERLAQSGRGLTWTDGANQANGGNCYNCHQIAPKEISFGTIGPSLYQYGKVKGNSEEALRDTWTKIFNSKASNACSNMPRGGHMGILKEKDIKDLMALLHDPESPVNK